MSCKNAFSVAYGWVIAFSVAYGWVIAFSVAYGWVYDLPFYLLLNTVFKEHSFFFTFFHFLK